MNDPREIIKSVCQGNEHAESFCLALWTFCHAMDDFIDRDTPHFDPHEFANALIGFVIHVSINPFYELHKRDLLPILVQSSIAWGDSMAWEKSGDSQKVNDAEVLKGMYHEIFYHVAFLVGGISHAQTITKRFREYNHEDRGSNYGILR